MIIMTYVAWVQEDVTDDGLQLQGCAAQFVADTVCSCRSVQHRRL